MCMCKLYFITLASRGYIYNDVYICAFLPLDLEGICSKAQIQEGKRRRNDLYWNGKDKGLDSSLSMQLNISSVRVSSVVYLFCIFKSCFFLSPEVTL